MLKQCHSNRFTINRLLFNLKHRCVVFYFDYYAKKHFKLRKMIISNKFTLIVKTLKSKSKSFSKIAATNNTHYLRFLEIEQFEFNLLS